MPKSPREIIATWPKWKRELAGHKEREAMKKSLSEQIVEQFRAIMRDKKLSQTEVGAKMGATPANVSRMLTKKENLTISTIERLAAAIGGVLEVKFIPEKTELDLLREENERLKKMLGAKRYVENGTLNKRS
jgi:transcriptional regulator with XRE-family HTH domain